MPVEFPLIFFTSSPDAESNQQKHFGSGAD